MKNKRLTILFSIFLIIVLVIILSSTIFAVENVEIQFVNTSNELQLQSESIISSASFYKGQSIFFINKPFYIKRIYKNYPSIKVINIESIFPNKLIIHATERKQIACFYNNSKYVVFDDELFAVSVENSRVGVAPPILINTNMESFSYELGSSISLKKSKDNQIKNILYCLQEWKTDIEQLKINIAEITLDYEIENQVLIAMRSGLSIIIKDCQRYTSDKLNLAFSYYDSNYQNCKNGGKLLIISNTDNEITGYYSID